MLLLSTRVLVKCLSATASIHNMVMQLKQQLKGTSAQLFTLPLHLRCFDSFERCEVHILHRLLFPSFR